MSRTRPKPIESSVPGRAGQPLAPKPYVVPVRSIRRRREPDWVAWTNDGSRPLARAATFEEAREAARALGEPDPILEPAQIRGRQA